MINSTQALYENLYQRILPAAQSPGECRSITLLLLNHYYQLDALAVALDKSLSPGLPADVLQDIVARLQQQEPIQYILETAYFLNREWMVTTDVLIPRPETEELVTLILRENKLPGLHVLDIGTGSGCIAITLAQELNHAHVDAVDISEQALKVARHNTVRHQAAVTWHQMDIFESPLPDKKWDIIVSNPPYVCTSEKQHMQQRVLSYEPTQALFVPDENPLIFYKRIAQLASTHLKPTGKLYLEINERFGTDVATLFNKHPFKEVYIGKDLHGKDRWVTARIAHQNTAIS
jgi:release factor glutamine methyltransferase